MIDVELEQFTEGVADGESAYVSDRRRHFVPYQGRKGTLDFSRDDRIAVEILLPRGKGWIQVGLLDCDLSRDDMIAVDATGQEGLEQILKAVGQRGGVLCVQDAQEQPRSLMERSGFNARLAAQNAVQHRKSS